MAGGFGVARSQGGGATFYWIHTDHLGTPLAVTNTPVTANLATAVWRSAYGPFARATVDEDPDGDTALVSLSVRFPGQLEDAESGLHYNYFRYYDAPSGRYLEVDPIGLQGGLNVFAYVGNNPARYVDCLGLVCTYSQSSGRMTCWPVSVGDADISSLTDAMDPYYDEWGYSGTDRGDEAGQRSVVGRINPQAQGIEDIGPITRGAWRVIGDPYQGATGPNTMRLEPLEGNTCSDTSRRCDTFRIHGALPWGADRSTGCIVLPPNRTAIPPGEVIYVTP